MISIHARSATHLLAAAPEGPDAFLFFRAANSACLRASTSWKLPLVPTTAGTALTAAVDSFPSSPTSPLIASSDLPSSASCLAFSSLAFFRSSCQNGLKDQPATAVGASTNALVLLVVILQARYQLRICVALKIRYSYLSGAIHVSLLHDKPS